MSSIIKPPVPKINWDNPLTKGLVFDVPLFERGGSTPLETIAKLLGTFNGTTKPVWVNTLYGTALQGGSDNTSSVSYTVSGNQTGMNTISIEILVYATQLFTNGNVARFFYKGTAGGTQRISFGFIGTGSANHNNSLEVQIGGTTTGVFETPAGGITTGNWYHVVITHNFSADGNVPIIYINGVSQTITTITATSVTNSDSTAVYLLNNTSALRGMIGYQMYTRFWNRILSSGEVVRLYSNPFGIYR